MATKSTPSPAHLATGALFVPPLSVKPESLMLAADVPLPPHAIVLYKVLRPATPEALEAARRTLIALRAGSSQSDILGNTLFSVTMERGAEQLYVFAVDASEGQSRARKQLAELKLDSMDVMESASFAPDGIFPCSRACAAQRTPCPSCISSSSSAVPTASSSSTSLSASATLLPRQHLRLPYAHFLRSLSNALSEELSNSSTPQLRMSRLRDDLVLFPPVVQGGWGIGWEHHGAARALVNCSFDVSLSSDRILFTPLLRATTFRAYTPDAPPERGTPITLLPHGTPAYFLSDYAGPRSTLTAHFRTALSGRGCGPWDSSVNSPSSASSSSGSENGKESGSGNPCYIVAWIVVQNKHGDDKGLAVVWPASLTLAYVPLSPSADPSSSRPFTPLAYTPSLPPELQPAPSALIAPPFNSLVSASTATPPPPFPPPRTEHLRPATTPGVRAVSTFALALHTANQADVKRVTATVGAFVDEAVRQRDLRIANMGRDAQTAKSTPTRSGSGVNDLSRTTAQASASASPAASVAAATSATTTTAQPFYPSPVTSGVPTDPPNAPPETAHPPIPIPAPQNQMQPATFDAFGGFDQFNWENGGYLTSDMNEMNAGMDINMNLGASELNMNMDLGGSVNMPAAGEIGKNSWDLGGADDIFTDADFDFWGSSAPAPKPAPRPSLSLSTSGGTGLTPGAGPAPLGGMFDNVATSGPGPPSASAMTPSASAWLPPPTPTNFVLPQSASVSFDPTPLTAVLQPSLSPERPIPELEPESFHPPQATDGYGPIAFAPTLAARDEKYAEGKFAFTGGLPSPPDEDMPMYTPTSGSFAAPTPRRASASFLNTSSLPTPRLAGLSASHPSRNSRASSLLAPTPRSATYSTTSSTIRTATTPLSVSAPAPIPWHLRYAAATDPRPGIVRALKRKATGQGLRERPRSSSAAWHDAWEDDLDEEDDEDVPETSDEESSIGEDSDEEDDAEGDGHSRARTPLPPYLLAGPSLLSSNFAHSHLLSLASPIRPATSTPFASSASTPPAMGAASVPTPVSPAALMGVASEKARSLEAAAQLLAREVVESTVWADAWEARTLGEDSTSMDTRREVWAADTARMLAALQRVRGVRAPLDLVTTLGESSRQRDVQDVDMAGAPRASSASAGKLEMTRLEDPSFAVSKGSSIISIRPPALRFWSKLGLGPRSGPKDVVAFAFFEDARRDGRVDLARSWMERLGRVYESANCGKHTLGRAHGCAQDGIVLVRFDTFRKTLIEFVQGLDSTTTNYVFYIIAPARIASLASPVLRQVFSAVKRAQKMYCEAQILFQFLPVHLVFSPSQHSMLCFACSVYDRVARPADRSMSRRFFERGPRVRTLVREPAFALAPPDHPTATLVRDHPLHALDAMNRHAFLHVAYGVAGRWLLAAAIDERGTAHELEVWALQEAESAHFIASTVWTFARKFATRASVEWRLFIVKASMMGAAEVDAWTETIDSALPTLALPMRVSLATYDTTSAPDFLPTHSVLPPPIATGAKQFFVKGELHLYVLPRVASIPLPVQHQDELQFFVPDPSDDTAPTTPAHTHPTSSSSSPAPTYASHASPDVTTYLRPIRSGAIVYAPANRSPTLTRLHVLHETVSAHSTPLIGKSETLVDELKAFGALSVLAQAKSMNSDGLPWHLAAVRIMEMALSDVNAGD